MLPLLLDSESSVASSVIDAASNLASSSSSTPPTTAADSDSLHSDAFKHDIAFITEPPVAHSQPDSHVPTEIVLKLETTPQPEATAKPIIEPSPEPITEQALEPIPDRAFEPITERASGPFADPAPGPIADSAVEPVATAAELSPKRARRSCAAAPVYNLSKLSGTAGHGKRRANGDEVAERRRRTLSGDTLLNDARSTRSSISTRAKSKAAIDALDLGTSAAQSTSPRSTRRLAQEAARSRRLTVAGAGAAVSSLGSRLSKIGKRGGNAVAGSMSRLSRELLRLRDTNEFSHIDDRPVVHTVWANGKYVDPDAPPPSPPQKKSKAQPEPEEQEEEEEPVTKVKPRGPKKFLPMGLYAGQTRPTLAESHLTPAERKKLDSLPELDFKKSVNTCMPAPMYMGIRLLIQGRDFKLPFHVCNPLPPGQPKPDEWKKMTKNRFIGNSKDYWRKSPHYTDYSKCVCKPEDGCGDNCQNRIMLYECNDINCNAGKETCTNRAFATLAARRAKGGKYRVGVEVIKTSDRGYGVRSNRCFQPHQIIMEYTGEIITEEECDRRMKNEYKNNECYYLMSFDQNMIIDATTGSIARFVNHSCKPNCRMIKWIVSGQPRMALFAGDKPIMTGDELTYDYNFDPFSAKNVQKCLCGSENCRGVLGPRPREPKAVKAGLTKVVKGTINAGKRKLKEMLGDEASDKNKTKKRKIQPASGVKASLSSASLKAAKGAANAAAKPVASLKRKITVKRMSGQASRKQLDGSKKRTTILSGRISPAGATTLTMSPGKASAKGTPRANQKIAPKGTPNSRRLSAGNTTKGKTTPKGKVTPKTNRRLSGKPKQVAKPTIKLVVE